MLRSMPKSSEFVFPSPHSAAGGCRVGFTRAVKTAKLKDFRFHDLRHTAGARLAAKRADAFAFCSIFGWSDIRLSLRYTHAMSDTERRAVENVAENPRPRDKNVTNEKRQASRLTVNDQVCW